MLHLFNLGIKTLIFVTFVIPVVGLTVLLSLIMWDDNYVISAVRIGDHFWGIKKDEL